MKHIFESVDDSPMFRSTASNIESGIDSLEKRCQRIMKGSKKYQEGIRLFADSQAAFAEYLEEFCGGPDEESMLLGGALMSKFVGVFKELGSYSELLRTQVEVILCERLQHSWVKGLLLTAKDTQKQLERRTAEYDSARLKHLGHSKVNAKWIQGAPERAQADMVAAEAAAEEARFEVARSLTELEGRKRYEFLEAVVSSVDAHLRFFENGVQVLKGLEPYLQHSLEVVDVLRREQRERMEGLEHAIAGFSQMKAARIADSAGTSTSQANSAASARGPMHVASNMSSVVNELEGFIRATVESNGAQVTVLKQGYLSKRSSNIRREWKRRFFVLDSAGQLYYFSNKERVDKRKTPQNTVSLVTSTIKPGEDEEERGRPLRYCFRVVSTDRSIALQADSEAEMRDWISTLQGVIACLLSGTVNLSKIQQLSLGKPAKPTHSRHGSLSSLDGFDLTTTVPSFSGGSLDLPVERTPSGIPATGTSQPALTRFEAPSRSGMELVRTGTQNSRPSWVGASPPPLRSQANTLQVLRQVPGNDRCADCGAADPDWASLNLGCCVCIQCSGVHRRLGVHISKVRSLTLDVKVWKGPVLGMMTALGNAAVNEVWEEALRRIDARSDSWVWNDDSDEESSSGRLHVSPEGQLASPPGADGDLNYLKPLPQHSAAAKEQFITAKYSERRFVVQAPSTLSQHSLCSAIASGNLKGVMRAVAAGADVNAPVAGPEASQLAAAVDVRLSEAGCASPSGRGSVQPNVTPLLLACQDRHPDAQSQVVEYLLQNGALWDFKDECGRQPLHYSIIFSRPDLAKSFLQRGADRTAKDAQGRTALDLAIAKGAVADDELFLTLSAEKPPVYFAW